MSTAEATARVFAALGDPTRLDLVALLCARGPQPIARLTEATDVTRQAVTKHLRVLEESGMVRREGEGRGSVWSLEPGRLDDARRWIDGVSAQWDDALARLRRHVED